MRLCLRKRSGRKRMGRAESWGGRSGVTRSSTREQRGLSDRLCTVRSSSGWCDCASRHAMTQLRGRTLGGGPRHLPTTHHADDCTHATAVPEHLLQELERCGSVDHGRGTRGAACADEVLRCSGLLCTPPLDHSAAAPGLTVILTVRRFATSAGSRD